MSEHPYFIGIAGNIGVGKTTMTDLIARRFGWRAFYESVIDNPYLEDFYQDMKRWSFNLQIYFLSHRFRSHKQMTESNITTVQDRTIYEDVEIFARNLYEMGNMSQRDWDNYRALFEIMTSYLKKPDLIVYLRASVDTLLTRIKKRSRGFERDISPEYIYTLNLSYERWIKEEQKRSNILIVETDQFDIFRDQEKLEEIMQKIKQFCP
ncbi:MAG: deoxynucleoside kinase [Candidatus Marinimicrobia bacterium]|nr:deoxynucleoside kinase [Candidatus Neomarinimicrobiota bacterium]MBP9004991.1 deoxynucleoside kinase [Candidatus Neomarinimicrobiota bacterium]HNZ36201.1 deoxynucleoside kinase [Candidatus Neomarinimicrobiota bacterium]HOD37269.1 deoxynucleoside kinase [Candidatus Neomarinimicrobiota bacterium]HOG75018.1 deoxynucleoside kinase [Candidatus Neomarinimicrobiota bacterium]